MSLETDVAALTTAANDLAAIINLTKQTADTANSTIAQIGGVAVTTATGNITLLSNSPTYQLINPNGVSRVVTLPAPGVSDRVVFAIKNTGTGSFVLNIKNASAVTVGVPIANGFSLTVIWTGTQWEVM